MSEMLRLRTLSLEVSSKLWRVDESREEPVLQLLGNTDVDHMGGQVALIDYAGNDYSMESEMRFVANHLSQDGAGWFGFAIRAQDLRNYEVVWFMPGAERGSTVAYLPVAHGIVPWWTEAYATQEKGTVRIPADAWFRARVDVRGSIIKVYVDGQFVFEKKLTYYLSSGRPGLYVGTATDAEFRRIVLSEL
ncbi:hypothetical protein [Limnochorda pilosa]|uniref:3-keto-disaccharide hydrolase domain-containing protein n=1 Tax=Limnochorda pilosa TaxID=1555112 RepID=A0A0K2SIU2_LIMPI|nr:hypothetical protein [Limnochorda pilosa]BAS26744.1 hypothetical protein LIP_0887 [Limnochorda pilosa]